jgi:hypothetical protein
MKLPTKEQIRNTATNALMRVAGDRQAPPAAVAAAARTLLESIGDIGRLQEVARQADKPPSTMGLREIDEELARLRDT